MWRQLVFALERTQVGIAVWDSNDRLVHSNPMFREFFAHVGPFDGMPHFSTITERTRRFYRYVLTVEADIEERLRRRRDGSGAG